ncbi:disease resistance TIR-NBS-LRR class family protein [Tanacetum coccineum]
MMKKRMCGIKVLLVLDDVDHIKQREALAGEWFKPGSRILITTRDEQVLVAHRVNVIRDIDLLSNQEASRLFIKVLGSILCGKDKLEWVDAIDRLKRIHLKETLDQLELSYTGLEDDYKEIFLDVVCMLKGQSKEYAIRVLDSCGFHARNGLKVLEQRYLITTSEYGELVLGMHDHIEEMRKNIVRREHPDEPYKHSHLWIDEEIKDILANDMGTQATRCLKSKKSTVNARIVMNGLGKMKKLRYLEVNFLDYDEDYDSESDCERKVIANVLKRLKLFSLSDSDLTTFEFRITPNLETLSLEESNKLVKLFMPVCCQKLKHLNIKLQVSVACPNLKFLSLPKSRLRSLDLELIPNIETLDLEHCHELVEINAPVGCLKKVGYLNLRGCLRFTDFEFDDSREPTVSRSTASLALVGESIDLCPLHPNSNLPKLQFHCYYEEDLPSSVGNIEKLISFGLCACTDLKKISDIICSLQCLQQLTVNCNIREFPKDLGELECLEELCLLYRRLSISKEALGAFGKSQTYRNEGFVIIIFVALDLVKRKDKYRGYDGGQDEQKQVEIIEDMRDKVHAEYHVLELQPEVALQNPCSKLVASRDKMVNMVGVGDVVLKTSFGTIWILKDVRNKMISSENDLRKSMLGHSLKLGTRNEEHQLRLDEEALIHTLEEEARANQEWEDKLLKATIRVG